MCIAVAAVVTTYREYSTKSVRVLIADVYQKRVNAKSAIIMAAAVNSCSTTMLAAKKHIAYRALIASRFSRSIVLKASGVGTPFHTR